MATLEDIVAVTKILSEDPDFLRGGSGSKPEENRARSSDAGNGGSASATDADVRKRDMETETVIESAFVEEKEKAGVKSSSVGANGVDDRVADDGSQDELVKSGRKNEIGEDPLNENGDEKLEGSGGEGLNMDAGGDGDGDGEEAFGEKMKDQKNTFSVGDFVWGKIKSHPWWPGQVYDPKDASDFAMQRRQEDRLLVAFFGDGTCSWCLPSQLIPFVENFKEMSTDSNSKRFLNAVESAVDEIGRLVESEMTCNCVPKEKKDELARLVVENAGLKARVVMLDMDVRRLSIPEFEPNEVLEKVVQLAKAASICSALDLAILRSQLSAFYYYKGGYQLPVYHVPLDIEGLEDKSKNVNAVASDFSVPIEVPILGPQEDDWLSSPAVGSLNSLGSIEDRASHKRKQKSVAELLGENKNRKPESQKKASVKEGADFGKTLSSHKRKKNKDEGEGNEGVASAGKKGRKNKVKFSESPKITKAKDLNAETSSIGVVDSVNGGAPSAGKKGRKRMVEVSETPKKRNAKDSNAETSSTGRVDGVNGRSLLRKPKEIEVPSTYNASSEAKGEPVNMCSPRERKKSKYLSPPFTNLTWRTGTSSPRTGLEVEDDKTIKIAQVGECPREAAENIVSSLPISKSVDNASDKKLPNGQLEKLGVSDDRSAHGVKKDEKLSFPASDVDSPVDELLSDIEFSATDPLYLSKKGVLDTVCAFVSALRSSNNLQGQDYKIHSKGKADGKRKSLPSQLGNDLIQGKEKSTSKASKSEKKSNTSNSRKAAEASIARSTMGKAEGTTSACLIVQFATGSPLPSKKEIVKLFSKFGSLDKKETKVEKESRSICIAYTKDIDAEEALKSSLSQSPFGSDNVNYKLHLSLAGSKTRSSHPKDSFPLKRATEKEDAPHCRDDLVSDLNTIRQKLEITTAIVENYHSRFSSEDKSSLKYEIKHLMEEVETVSEKVRVMAEKTSS